MMFSFMLFEMVSCNSLHCSLCSGICPCCVAVVPSFSTVCDTPGMKYYLSSRFFILPVPRCAFMNEATVYKSCITAAVLSRVSEDDSRSLCDLFGTRDKLCGRKFFCGAGGGQWFQAHYFFVHFILLLIALAPPQIITYSVGFEDPGCLMKFSSSQGLHSISHRSPFVTV